MSYDGAPFCGWQVQPSSPSVQGEMERALETLLKAPVGVVGAGRTDTGVSASRYVAHFDFDAGVPGALALPDGSIDCKQLTYKLNAILHPSIAVHSIVPVAPDFHARFDATCRQYQYFLHRVKDPFLSSRSYYYGYPDVDFEAMNRAALMLLGTHDFSCFEKSGGDNKTSICTVSRALWEPYLPDLAGGRGAGAAGSCVAGDPDAGSSAAEGPAGAVAAGSSAAEGSAGAVAAGAPYWRFTIEADRFLRNMVRAIVGTLLEVGRGRRTEAGFAALILKPDSSAPRQTLRSNAGESVPGHALFLTDIRY